MKTPNLFNYATSELSQDAFILWLLQWANPECLAYDVELHETAQGFVRLLLHNKGLQIRSIYCKKQENHIDVFAIINDEYALIIEDKTNTSEHSHQLERYSEWVKKEKRYENLDLYCIYYKTGNESTYRLKRLAESYKKDFPEENFYCITREEVLSVLSNCRSNNAIIKDYVRHIAQIQEETESYKNKPIPKWDYRCWQGFYLALEKELQDGDWGYVANPSGGFWAFWWHWKTFSSNKAIEIYLQFEQNKLCIKAYDEENEKVELKYSNRLLKVANENPGSVAIFMPALTKDDLFDYLSKDAVLPRKSFSMGHANEKRYYLEAKRITK